MSTIGDQGHSGSRFGPRPSLVRGWALPAMLFTERSRIALPDAVGGRSVGVKLIEYDRFRFFSVCFGFLTVALVIE